LNPHQPRPVSLPSLWHSLWGNRALISQMVRREVIGRYRGSALGLLWSFLNPLLMLVVYTFVFTSVFKARWGAGDLPPSQFAVVLFAGLLVHGLFAEVLNRAPQLILANVSYVKKVIFPLEILPVICMGAALFHGFVSLAVLLAAFAALNGFVHWTAVFIPIVLLPLALLATGCAWILSALGVFVRDVGQVVAVFTGMLLFLSPVFFPLTAVPAALQGWILLNPLTFIIEQARDVIVWGRYPDWAGLSLYLLGATAIAWFGYFCFQKSRKGFSDVL
jgi:lipopolysaccharide transport system permease protein